MFSRIVEISTAEGWNETYVEVEFWDTEADFQRGDPPALVNSFVMQLRVNVHGPVTDGAGRYQGEDGNFYSLAELRAVAPDLRPAIKTQASVADVPARILDNIRAFAARARARGDSGDKRDHGIRRSHLRDPHGVLSRNDVKLLSKATFYLQER